MAALLGPLPEAMLRTSPLAQHTDLSALWSTTPGGAAATDGRATLPAELEQRAAAAAAAGVRSAPLRAPCALHVELAAVDADLADLVLRLLAYDPTQRITAHEVHGARCAVGWLRCVGLQAGKVSKGGKMCPITCMPPTPPHLTPPTHPPPTLGRLCCTASSMPPARCGPCSRSCRSCASCSRPPCRASQLQCGRLRRRQQNHTASLRLLLRMPPRCTSSLCHGRRRPSLACRPRLQLWRRPQRLKQQRQRACGGASMRSRRLLTSRRVSRSQLCAPRP